MRPYITSAQRHPSNTSVRFVPFTSTICRPFYVSTTTSVPRDVVVALDISNTMRGNKLNEARRAVLTVFETLSVKDNVSLYIWEVACF